MSALFGILPANSYKQLLNIGNSNVGLTGSIQYITDGAGTSSVLGLSSTAVQINASSITINGAVLTMSSGNINFTGVSSAALTITGTSSISGSNTGDQTITLTGNVTGSGTGSFSTTIANNAVTYAKIQQVAASRLVGNPTGSPANMSEISLGTNLSFAGNVLNASSDTTATYVIQTTDATLTNAQVLASLSSGFMKVTTTTGVISSTGNTTIQTADIGANQVTYAKVQQVGAKKLLGNTTGSTANVAEIATSTFIQSVSVQTFLSSGTYTPTANMVYCIIECIGGGGGGGGTATSAVGSACCAGAGGAGSKAIKRCTASDIGASQTVTIGAAGTGASAGNNTGTTGGDTSVGTLCIAKGGAGGSGSSGSGNSNGGAGGASASCTGDLKFTGNRGAFGNSQTIITTPLVFTCGGLGFGGGSANSGVTTSGGAGAAASDFGGSGGNGGTSWNNSGTAAGGNGGAGYILITEFIAV